MNTNIARNKLLNKTREYRIDKLMVPATREVVEGVNNVSGMIEELSS